MISKDWLATSKCDTHDFDELREMLCAMMTQVLLLATMHIRQERPHAIRIRFVFLFILPSPHAAAATTCRWTIGSQHSWTR